MYVLNTIAAIATPVGEGGIGIIRISGDHADQIGAKIFQKKPDGGFQSHRFYYGSIVDNDEGRLLDEVMVVLMKSPRSYTREDVLEIHCHGGFAVLRSVLGLVLRNGARMAEPGEFTRRAFLNGRVDLIQAEAVMDIIRGKTDTAVSLAQHQREGMLSKQIAGIREGMVNALALLEAHIDFPEEEIGREATQEITGAVKEAHKKIIYLLDGFDEGRSLREGVSVLIAGKPNAGKSSLLNTLVRDNRAIVNAMPGTTRDIIEEVVNLGGLPVRLLDTAGICESEDEIEKEGIRLAIGKIPKADLILFLIDSSRPFDDDDLRIENELSGNKFIVVLNKTDLPVEIVLPETLRSRKLLHVSTKTGNGIELLKQEILDQFLHGKAVDSREYVAVSNIRHRDALEKCAVALMRFIENEHARLDQEFLAADLRDALNYIGEITGDTAPDEVLDRIFERFCIGK